MEMHHIDLKVSRSEASEKRESSEFRWELVWNDLEQEAQSGWPMVPLTS